MYRKLQEELSSILSETLEQAQHDGGGDQEDEEGGEQEDEEGGGHGQGEGGGHQAPGEGGGFINTILQFNTTVNVSYTKLITVVFNKNPMNE